jgi:AraC-like DNA-binding protein
MLTDSGVFENVHYLPLAPIIDMGHSLFLWLFSFLYINLYTLKGAKMGVILKMRFGEEEEGMVLVKGKKLKITYSTYLWSYIIVLILPLAVNLIGYTYAHKLMRDQITDIHNNILSQTRQSCDQMISVVDAQAYGLISNNNLDSLKVKSTWEVKDLFLVQKLVSNLSNITNTVPYLNRAAVLFYGSDSIVTNQRRYAPGLHAQFYSTIGIDEAAFKGKIDLTTPKGDFIADNTSGQRYVCFYRNVYDVMYKQVVATIVMSVPVENFAQVGSNVDLSKDGGFIVCKGDTIISSLVPSDTAGFITGKLKSERQVSGFRMDKKTYVASFVNSEVNDYKYCIYTPKSYFYKNLNYLRLIILLEIGLCIVLGGILARVFAKESFYPIDDMLRLLEKNKKSDTDSATYDSLKNALTKMLDENEELEKNLKTSESFAKRGLLVSALKGWTNADNIVDDVISTYNSELYGCDYRIVLFRAFDISRCPLVGGSTEEERVKNFRLIVYSMENVIEEILSCKNTNICEIDGMIALFYNVTGEEEDQSLESKIRKCLDFYTDMLGISVYSTVSSIHEDPSELSAAYEEAYEAAMHKNFWGSEVSDIVMYDREILSEHEETQTPKLVHNEKKLLNALITKDYKDANEILDDIIDTHMKKDIKLLRYNQYQAAGIVNTLFEVFRELSMEADDEFIDNIGISERLARSMSVKRLRGEIHSIFNEIIEYFDEKKTESCPPWIEQVRAYLEENYMDDTVNISAIADKFHMSLAHMGRTYKKYTGEGMLDYIHRVRINHCKEMLDNGYTVKEAAESNGYIDSKAMIRAFKRYEGVTPGQYKNAHSA